MSLTEIIGTPKYKEQVKINTNVSPVYVAAVQQVRTAKKGTLISAIPKVTSELGVPKALGSPQDFFGSLLAIGSVSRQGTVTGLTSFQAMNIKTTPAYDIRTGYAGKTTIIPVSNYLNDAINVAKAKDPEMKKYWEGSIIPNIDLPGLPGFPDIFGGITDAFSTIGKYALVLAGAGLIGIYLITRKQ